MSLLLDWAPKILYVFLLMFILYSLDKKIGFYDMIMKRKKKSETKIDKSVEELKADLEKEKVLAEIRKVKGQ